MGSAAEHRVDWDGTRVLDRATRPILLKVKEALHIERTPANTRLNRDGGYELPGCLDRYHEEARGRGQTRRR